MEECILLGVSLGKDNPNSLNCSSAIYHNNTVLKSGSGNSMYGFSHSYQNAIDVRQGDIIKVTTSNTAYTSNNTSLCLTYN